ncbi:MAG TPA: hypothetical protein VG028_06735 [Terriglobia bacterium]|nr:hypothetical protein [Terriglobia bacterium]
MRKQVISAVLGFALLSPSILAAPQTEAPPLKITDLFTQQERRNAGLSKLDSSELAALNAALARILLQFDSELSTRDSPTLPQSNDEVDLYDSSARAVAYIASDKDLTIYLWSGKPVAYLEDDSIYGFNGKHLGWFLKGTVHDHDGNVVAAIAENFRGPVGLPP